MGSLDVVEYRLSGKLGLGENLGPPQHDFNHLEKVIGEMRLFWGRFWSFWSSDWGPWGHGCAAWAPWIWMRLDEVTNWVWVRIQGHRDMILTIRKGDRGNASILGVFLVILGL